MITLRDKSPNCGNASQSFLRNDGICSGRTPMPDSSNRQRTQSAAPAEERQILIDELKSIVGAKNVVTGEHRTCRHRTGYRFGCGKAAAVVRPGSLLEQSRVLKACVLANKIIIMQAANTGLTGGSTSAARSIR